MERAADWVFSHTGELDAMETEPPEQPQYDDGPGSKEMAVVISRQSSHKGLHPR